MDENSHPRQINRSLRNVNIHQEVDDSRLNVSLMLVNDDFFAGVVDFHVRISVLFGLMQWLIFLLVMLDAQAKIVQSIVLVHIRVVGTADLDLDDVLLYEVRIVANRLDEEQLEFFLLYDDILNHLTSLVCRIGCVKHLLR